MDVEQGRVREEELRAVVASRQERWKAHEERLIDAEQTVTRARSAVARYRRVWALIATSPAGLAPRDRW
jgi:hypothetical protein